MSGCLGSGLEMLLVFLVISHAARQGGLVLLETCSWAGNAKPKNGSGFPVLYRIHPPRYKRVFLRMILRLAFSNGQASRNRTIIRQKPIEFL